MANRVVRGVARDSSGNAVSEPTVTVYLAGTATLATIFSTIGGAAETNPFTGDADGEWEFFVDAATSVKVKVEKTGFTTWEKDYIAGGITAHGDLTGLTTGDPHTQYDRVRVLDARRYGTEGDGAAIQAAVDALGADGGIVWVPPGDWTLSATLEIGDGSASAASTKHAIRIIGGVAAGHSAEITAASGDGARIVWTGAAGADVVSVNGPIMFCSLENISIVGNGGANEAAVGLRTFHAAKCKFKNLNISGFSGIGVKVDAVGSAGRPSGVVIGGDDCVWENVFTQPATAGGSAVGLDFGADTAGGVATDNARHTFINCTFRGGTGASGRGMVIRFVDNVTFVMTHFVGGSANTAIEIVPPSGDTSFPKVVTFLHGVITGNIIVTGSWTAPGHGIWCAPLVVEAGSVPNISQIRGFAGAGSFGAAVVNEQGHDVDWRVEGVSEVNGMYYDASTNRLGLGTATPLQRLHLVDGLVRIGTHTIGDSALSADDLAFSAVRNVLMIVDSDNNSTTSNFAVSKDANPNSIIFQAREDGNVGLGGGGSANFFGGAGVVFIANRTTAPSSTPTTGIILSSATQRLKVREDADRFLVQAAASTKTTAGAPFTNDGYVEVVINGTTVRLMTTA